MKKKDLRRLVCLLLVVLMVPFQGVLAASKITATMREPDISGAKAGDRLTYHLDIGLPQGYQDDYDSMTLTLMLDEKIKVVDHKLLGVAFSNEAHYLQVTELSSSGKNIVNLSINDMGSLGGAKTFTLEVVAQVREGNQTLDQLESSYVLSYLDKAGNASHSQENISTKPQKAQKSDDPDYPEGVKDLALKPVKAGQTQVQGKTLPGALVRLSVGTDQVGDGLADENGLFTARIRAQATGAVLKLSATKGAHQVHTQTIVKKGDGPQTYPHPKNDRASLQDFVDAARHLNRTNFTEEEILRLEAAISKGNYYLVKGDLTEKEAAQAISDLELAMKAVRPAYLKGYPDGTFKPKNPMTRAEVSSMFAGVMTGGQVPQASASFKDVKKGSWYDPAVAYMEINGLIQGYEDDTFKPDRSITRAEFASIVVKYAAITSKSGAKSFEDVPNRHWAKENIDRVTAAGLMSGRSDKIFSPDEKITRQEVATVMNKALFRPPNKAFLLKYSTNPFSDLSHDSWAYAEILEAAGR